MAKHTFLLSVILTLVYSTGCANNETTFNGNYNNTDTSGAPPVEHKHPTAITSLHSAGKQKLAE